MPEVIAVPPVSAACRRLLSRCRSHQRHCRRRSHTRACDRRLAPTTLPPAGVVGLWFVCYPNRAAFADGRCRFILRARLARLVRLLGVFRQRTQPCLCEHASIAHHICCPQLLVVGWRRWRRRLCLRCCNCSCQPRSTLAPTSRCRLRRHCRLRRPRRMHRRGCRRRHERRCRRRHRRGRRCRRQCRRGRWRRRRRQLRLARADACAVTSAAGALRAIVRQVNDLLSGAAAAAVARIASAVIAPLGGTWRPHPGSSAVVVFLVNDQYALLILHNHRCFAR